MRKSLVLTLATVCVLAAGATAMASPDGVSLVSFLDGKGLSQTHPQFLQGRLVSTCQDDGWGWGEAEPPPPEEKPADNGSSSGGWGEGDSGGSGRADQPPSGEKWGEEWGSGGQDEWNEAGPTPGGGEEAPIVPAGPKVNWARKTKIGIDIGGFLPFGEKKESYSTGQIASLFLGFGLLDLGGLTVSNQFRLVEGYTSSLEQTNGYDITTILFMIRDEFHFHFIPMKKSFDFFAFLGIAVAFESSSGTRVNPVNGETETTSGFYYGFLADAGLGASFNLVGPVDAILRLEFNMIPVSENVQFFLVGELGIQIRV